MNEIPNSHSDELRSTNPALYVPDVPAAPRLTHSVKSADGLRWLNSVAGPPKIGAMQAVSASGRPNKCCIYCSRPIALKDEVRFKIGPNMHAAHAQCKLAKTASRAVKTTAGSERPGSGS